MNSSDQIIPSPREVVRILAVNAWYWLIPAVVLAALAACYASLRQDTWEASQALVVRNEAANNELRPGKFIDNDERKTVQETILELAKSRGVLGTALEEVGPPADYKRPLEYWPTARDLTKSRKNIEIVPPEGAEFGKTEVFYLHVRDHSRARAVALSRAICDQLEARFQQLRDTKAQSMIDELVKTVQLAKADLAESTSRLTGIEKEVGSDLAELRVLNEPGSGDSALRRTIGEIQNELRQIHATQKVNQRLLAALEVAREDPSHLVATPNRLLESQPALRRLKDGLVDAQLRTASLKGKMTNPHPLVQASMQAEEEIRQNLHEELADAIRGLQVELRLDADRVGLLECQLAKATDRLSHLAGLRAEYDNQLAENLDRTGRVERAAQDLAEARAALAGANASSLISRIDVPETGSCPIGLSRGMIILIGIVGGLLAGFGIVFLTAQPQQPAAAKQAEPEKPAPSAQSVYEPAEPNFLPGGNLSFNEALQKIDCCSKL